jgi:glycerol-1-phosphatase
VEHAPPAVAEAARAGMRLAYVTNNASRRPTEVAEHLRRLGYDADPESVVTSAQAAARVLAERLAPGASVLVVGSDGMREEVRAVGLTVVDSADDEPDAVVQGHSPDTGWAQLVEACLAIDRGALWVASNTDLTLPTPRGRAPGNGALVEAVAAATRQRPVVAGKPEPALHAESVERTSARSPIVVGDRLDTDVEGAVRAGCASLLVLTGVTDLGELLEAAPGRRPSFVGADLRSLLLPQPEVVRDGGSWRCGSWQVHADSGALRLRQAGEPDAAGPARDVAVLRALCAAGWESGETTRQAGDAAAESVLAALG